jgi:hypothetical protein
LIEVVATVSDLGLTEIVRLVTGTGHVVMLVAQHAMERGRLAMASAHAAHLDQALVRATGRDATATARVPLVAPRNLLERMTEIKGGAMTDQENAKDEPKKRPSLEEIRKSRNTYGADGNFGGKGSGKGNNNSSAQNKGGGRGKFGGSRGR